eukprot:CAMPEP_0183311400 /NCGR_PEP_ID=MMETSP0160_2-20130417/36677_1 /TAXON_ID=2839 ORGANISM="Odontella Sinensis, Strain Grunow 1884" /NCGR_SAMPLE_ID=MMETSP0160_2 /ASSEMBLY_ACC=CAM_ASM_000250 /LENGTH=100 /DNA_ID=CAMNT_0025475959 /DNA_START=44 /DNA_END=346 /DNA_ORIENTATION=+
MPQSNDVVDLTLFFDEWTRCVSSRYQRDSLYRFGKFDSCSAQYRDLKAAIRAKLKTDPDEARRIIESTHYSLRLGSDPANSPTAGVIWELKEKPGWDVEE